MSGASRVDDDLTRRIDAACDQFEADWKAGRTPRIEDHLGSVPAAGRPELLRQLLAVELSYRRRRVEAPGPDEYRRRFPGHAELVDRAFERTVVVDAGRGPGRAGPGPTVDLGDRPVGDGEGPAESPGWIGKYHVVRPLGRGGQATALLAFDPDLERHVVLKRYHLGDGARAERALEEGRALARVSSPHVARCLGVERRGGEVLLVVEHVAGRDLERAYRERPPCPAAAARLVAQAAAGLAAVHACGLLHRDLKPANILRGDDGVARLVDFGLAAGVGSAALGELSGTPAYMAPEQARAEPERIGVRTDVFGLGAVLYCLLTGSPPYRGRDAGEILEQARQGRITPPRALNPRVPRALERICLQALAADPAARQATAAELAAQLQGFARGPRRAAGVAAVTGALLLAALGAWGGPRRP
ncbi:MAG TPA: serine/threonine-protein kinase, partial [Isosphaeraceae bacterium]